MNEYGIGIFQNIFSLPAFDLGNWIFYLLLTLALWLWITFKPRIDPEDASMSSMFRGYLENYRFLYVKAAWGREWRFHRLVEGKSANYYPPIGSLVWFILFGGLAATGMGFIAVAFQGFVIEWLLADVLEYSVSYDWRSATVLGLFYLWISQTAYKRATAERALVEVMNWHEKAYDLLRRDRAILDEYHQLIENASHSDQD